MVKSTLKLERSCLLLVDVTLHLQNVAIVIFDTL